MYSSVQLFFFVSFSSCDRRLYADQSARDKKTRSAYGPLLSRAATLLRPNFFVLTVRFVRA